MTQVFKLKGLYNFYSSEFQNKNIEIADLDWLVCEVLKIKRAEIVSKQEITKKEFKQIIKLANIRLKGKPVDRILGWREFYGRKFIVGGGVLSPRSETEILCETVLKNSFKNSKILEIGTGSGVISITLKKENELFDIIATDISSRALRNAKKNAKVLQASISFKKSFVFNDISTEEKFDVIVSNPPYIPTRDILDLDKEVVRFDPKLALDGGADGLFFYKEIIENACKYLKSGGKIFFEIGIGQSEDVKKMLEKEFCDIQIIKDYSGIDRIIWAKKKEEVC